MSPRTALTAGGVTREVSPMLDQPNLCACGCGTEIPLRSYSRDRRFAHGHNRRKGPAVDRFWSKVTIVANGCWLWNGHIEKNGYGRFYAEGKMQWAHRWIWQNENGLLPKGMFVCHHCDNPRCVRLDHLFVGTHTDNMRDSMAKGRHRSQVYPNAGFTRCPPERLARGEANGLSKLTQDQVADIRLRYAAGGVTLKELADERGVSISTIHSVVRRVTWIS